MQEYISYHRRNTAKLKEDKSLAMIHNTVELHYHLNQILINGRLIEPLLRDVQLYKLFAPQIIW